MTELGTVSRRKKLLLFWILSELPPSPPFGQLVQLFSDVEIQDSKVSLGLKILCVLYIILHIYNPKEQITVQIIGILGEIDFFIDHKCTS